VKISGASGAIARLVLEQVCILANPPPSPCNPNDRFIAMNFASMSCNLFVYITVASMGHQLMYFYGNFLVLNLSVPFHDSIASQ
jgi:hypothetical protein